jgi:hypothetical protein
LSAEAADAVGACLLEAQQAQQGLAGMHAARVVLQCTEAYASPGVRLLVRAPLDRALTRQQQGLLHACSRDAQQQQHPFELCSGCSPSLLFCLSAPKHLQPVSPRRPCVPLCQGNCKLLERLVSGGVRSPGESAAACDLVALFTAEALREVEERDARGADAAAATLLAALSIPSVHGGGGADVRAAALRRLSPGLVGQLPDAAKGRAFLVGTHVPSSVAGLLQNPVSGRVLKAPAVLGRAGRRLALCDATSSVSRLPAGAPSCALCFKGVTGMLGGRRRWTWLCGGDHEAVPL